jgi:DNA-binding transcriptional LysR family regulator
MELHQVRYFLALAKTLNFTRASEQCNVTQPALTKGVQKLEQELGGQLIYRERQLTQLTDLGKEVLPMLERTLASAEAVRRKAQEFQRKEVAPLKIGLAPSISASLVLDPIAEIAKFVPGLHVELREAAAGTLVDLLLGGEINAAMVGDVPDMPTRIDDWPLFEERYVVLLAHTHRLANRASIGMNELSGTILLERSGCDVALKIRNSCFPEESPHLGYCSGHELHLQHMAAAGFGVILAPEHMPRLPTLKTIPIEGNPVWREVRLLAVQGRRYSPALDAFVKVARLRDWSPEVRLGKQPQDLGRAITLEGGLRNEQRAQLMRAASACPVGKTLSLSADIRTRSPQLSIRAVGAPANHDDDLRDLPIPYIDPD